METKIQLRHPAGKNAVSMDKAKYDVLKKILLNLLKTKGESTHADILQAITGDFKKNKTKFPGSVEWHMEWVKLDLEARKKIKRKGDKSPVKFVLAGRDSL
ncbi:MAG TPA: hypothetical protein VJY62_13050 [Bacteroidia bacterium]|nr:hypothetical protein [Bacteroidia bacterium]